jgi:hypothetical protein
MKPGPKLVPKSKKKKQPSELEKLLEEARFLLAHWKDLESRIEACISSEPAA